MKSGELARLAGVSTDTLRHYERIGVLAVARRTANGYRQYPDQALDRVNLVRRALAMGFSLSELTRILKERDRGGAPCRQVRALATEKLAQLERRIAEAQLLRDQLKTTLKSWDPAASGDSRPHHFLMRRDGGIIDVSAKDAKDSGSRDQIRMHLRHISQAFAAGDFDLPMFIHDRTGPGVEVMKSRASEIQYRYVKTERGAQVRITTTNAEALQAIHEFLRFQIKDHETGDPLR